MSFGLGFAVLGDYFLAGFANEDSHRYFGLAADSFEGTQVGEIKIEVDLFAFGHEAHYFRRACVCQPFPVRFQLDAQANWSQQTSLRRVYQTS